MFRFCFAALAALALNTAVNAEEIKGKVARVDAAGNTLTLTVDGKDTTYKVAKDASFTAVSTMPDKKKKNKTVEKVDNLDKGLAAVTVGANVTVLADANTIASVKVTGAAGPDAKKKKKAKKAAK